MSAPEASGSVERLLSRAQARELLGLSRAGLDRLMQAGELDTVKIGRRRLVEPEELRRFIAARRVRRRPENDEDPAGRPGFATTSAEMDGGDGRPA